MISAARTSGATRIGGDEGLCERSDAGRERLELSECLLGAAHRDGRDAASPLGKRRVGAVELDECERPQPPRLLRRTRPSRPAAR